MAQIEKLEKKGFILPPPDIRKIIDKTSEFVAKNGAAFEELVIKAESNNPKFSFLKKDDPFRAYYDSKILEFKEGSKPSEQKPQTQTVISQQNAVQTLLKKEMRKTDLKPPQPDKYHVDHPKNITPLEMDIIRHSAQFVAKNGQKFLIALTEREKSNPQFDFLKPTHPMFSFFTSLVDSYSKCLAPKKEDIVKIQSNVEDKMSIFRRAADRYEWEYFDKQSKKKKQEIDEEERQQIASIDWNDFVIVETIDLFDDDTQLRIKPQEEKPEELIEEIQPQPQEELKILELPKEQIEEIKRQSQENGDGQNVKCQVCSQMIPVSDFNDHIRICLMDPKYVDHKNQLLSRNTNTTSASNKEFASQLSQFSKKRMDIFGNPDNEADQKITQKGGAKAGEVWDGQSANMTRTTANIAMMAQQQKKNLQELYVKSEIKTLNKPQMPPPQFQSQQQEDLGLNLEPEKEWLQKHPEPINVTVQIPNGGEDEQWDFFGQQLQIPIKMTTTIENIKNSLNSIIKCPMQKQRLSVGNIPVLKDSQTAAYYNLTKDSVIYLNKK